MTINIGLPAFDVATIMGLAVFLGAFGRFLQVRADWTRYGVGDFSYRYLTLVMLSNLGLAWVARELLAPIAFAVCLLAVGLHAFIACAKIQSYIKNRFRI
jgi:hypothetical protein